MNNHLVMGWLPGLLTDLRGGWGGVKKRSKKGYSVLANVPQDGQPQAGGCLLLLSTVFRQRVA